VFFDAGPRADPAIPLGPAPKNTNDERTSGLLIPMSDVRRLTDIARRASGSADREASGLTSAMLGHHVGA